MNFFLYLSIILVAGGALGFAFNRIKLPALLAYMELGIFLGSCGLMNAQLLTISSELRKITLIIILLKAGLALEFDDLKRVGRPAILLSLFCPAAWK